MLSGGTAAGTKDRDKCLDDGLRELGWIEGQNLVVDRRWAEGGVAREPALAEELVRLRPDLIVTSGTPAAQAVQRATREIPVVFTMASGLMSNLARPDGNVTGVSNFFPAMISKLLELIETAFGAKRIAVLHDPLNPGKQIDMRYLQESARALQVAIEPAPLHGAGEVETAFAAMAKDRPGALIVLVDAITISNMQPIVQHVAELKLPAIYQERTFVERGGLMSYASNYCQHLRRAETRMKATISSFFKTNSMRICALSKVARCSNRCLMPEGAFPLSQKADSFFGKASRRRRRGLSVTV